MDKITKRFIYISIVITLTISTQVGGIIWLICFPFFKPIKEKVQKKTQYISYQILLFLSLYLGLSFTIIPFFAEKWGRIPLPLFQEKHIQPLNIMTCIMNRHYVTPTLKMTLEQSAKEFEDQYPLAIITYLDANFPFITGFPLLPHRSHDDGEKIDLAFFYTNTHSHLPMYGESLTAFGYGIFEEPKEYELNMARRCINKGAWQYDILKYFATNRKRKKMKFDEEHTKKLIQILHQKNAIKKIFLEPHLKARLKLNTYQKIRFHGCKAVRHDDHLHIQL